MIIFEMTKYIGEKLRFFVVYTVDNDKNKKNTLERMGVITPDEMST